MAGYVTATHARWLVSVPHRRWRIDDATLVFADVSGFTAMSAKLAEHGKIGAEEATEAVNRVFAGLLATTAAAGGEVLKFGGDSVLAYFTGEAHESRGASAALAMQGSMRPLRQLKTTAGTVNLRLSAGVASGRVHLFLAGSAPCELIVAGPLTTEVVALESAAPADQVLAGAETLAALPQRCAGERIEHGRLLRCAPAVPTVPTPTIPDGFDPRLALPPHLRDHQPGDGEHRLATIGFLQFRGVDDVLARKGPDALARALDEIVGSTAEACLLHGVTIVSTDVDRDAGKIILATGVPTASHGDEDRLLHALRSVVGTGQPLPVRAGVYRGRIFMVDIGTPQRRVWSVIGEAVNLAARVMERAEPGQLLASESALEPVRDDFERSPLKPFPVKGKTGLLHAEVVGTARGARRVSEHAHAPLVGREQELAILRDMLDAARRGEHVAVELVGEPGIGKSRLADAAVAAAEDFTVIAVGGGPYAVHSPYAALRAPLRELLDTDPDATDATLEAVLRRRVRKLDASLEPWLPLVAIPLGLALPPTAETRALSPEFARQRLHVATGRLLEQLLPGHAMLLVVEDAHWLDEASSEFLAYLARQPRMPGSFVLVTRRSATEDPTLGRELGAVVLDLGPLDETAARELVSRDDLPLPLGVEDTLLERAAGNPLLLRELLAAARAGSTFDSLPDTVEALMTARIDTVPDHDRNLLRETAVLGLRVPTSLLRELSGMDAASLRGTLLRLDDFLAGDGTGTVRFRHALIRDAAYEGLSFRRRRELHARAAALVEERVGQDATAQVEFLAIHFHAAHRWREAWRYAIVAAERALDRAAPIEAAGFFGMALEAGRAMRIDGLELASVGERQGDAYRLGGRFREASAAFEDARRRARGHPVTEANLCRKIGVLRGRSKHLPQALRWLTQGLKTLDGETSSPEVESLRAHIWLNRGSVSLRSGRLLEAAANGERAAELAQASGNRSVLAEAYTVLHWVYAELGSPEKERYRDLALPIFEELEDYEWQGKTLNHLGIDAYWSGRWGEAIAFYERGREALERVGDVVEAAVLLSNIAEIHSDQGRLDEAEHEQRTALATFRGAGFPLGVGQACINLGRLACRRRDTYAAAELFARARATLADVGAARQVLELETREAERFVLSGELVAALRVVETLRRKTREQRAPAALLPLVERVGAHAMLQAGDVEGARVCLRESVELARAVGATYEEALALEALGRAGGDDAEDAAAAAAELLDGLGVVGLASVRLPI